MKKLFTTLGCAVALAAFALPASAQDYTFNEEVTLGGSGSTECNIYTGEDLGTFYISLVSDNKTDYSQYIKLSRDLEIFQLTYSVSAVEMSDGYYAYNILSSDGDETTFGEDSTILFEFDGPTAVTFTITEGYQGGTSKVEIVLGTSFTLPNEEGATKAVYTYVPSGDDPDNQVSESAAYLKTNSSTNLYTAGVLSFDATGDVDILEDATAVLVTEEDGTSYYGYNFTLQAGATYTLAYDAAENDNKEVEFTLALGTLKGSSETYMEDEAAVVYPENANPYALTLNEMIFSWGDQTIAPVYTESDEITVFGMVTVTKDGESPMGMRFNWDVFSYTPVDDSGNSGISPLAQTNQTGNAVSVDLMPLTNPSLLAEEGDSPVPGVYEVSLPDGLVKNTETGELNIAQSFTVTVLAGVEGEGSVSNGSLLQEIEEFTVTFPGKSATVNEDAGACSLNIGGNVLPVPVTISDDGLSITWSNLDGFVGDLVFNVPATYLIITDEDGVQYLNEEFTGSVIVEGPDTVEGTVYPKINTVFGAKEPVEITVTFEDVIAPGSEGIVLLGGEGLDVEVAAYTWEDETNLYITDQKVLNINLGVLAQGNYELVIREGVVEVGEDAINAGIDYTFSTSNSVGINSIQSVDGETVIYNLQGQKVKNADKGIYIINGKKVMVK